MPINFVVDGDSKVPPFEQIKQQVITAISDRSAFVDEKLPAIRALATDLGLAVNTVARSYRELEEEGFVVTRGRSGTRISPDAVPHKIALAQLASEFVSRAGDLGVSVQDAIDAVESAFQSKQTVG